MHKPSTRLNGSSQESASVNAFSPLILDPPDEVLLGLFRVGDLFFLVSHARVTEVVDPRDGGEHFATSAGWMDLFRHCVISSIFSCATGQSATRSRRDRHDGNADACTSGISRRNMDY